MQRRQDRAVVPRPLAAVLHVLLQLFGQLFAGRCHLAEQPGQIHVLDLLGRFPKTLRRIDVDLNQILEGFDRFFVQVCSGFQSHDGMNSCLGGRPRLIQSRTLAGESEAGVGRTKPTANVVAG